MKSLKMASVGKWFVIAMPVETTVDCFKHNDRDSVPTAPAKLSRHQQQKCSCSTSSTKWKVLDNVAQYKNLALSKLYMYINRGGNQVTFIGKANSRQNNSSKHFSDLIIGQKILHGKIKIAKPSQED